MPKPLILVIDDEQVIARTLAIILQRAGYATEFFYSAEAALEFAQTHQPDLIVSDVVLNGMSGIELARTLSLLFPSLPHILISGQVEMSQLIGEARARGEQVDVLAKPVRPEVLLEKIAGLLAAARMESGVSVAA